MYLVRSSMRAAVPRPVFRLSTASQSIAPLVRISLAGQSQRRSYADEPRTLQIYQIGVGSNDYIPPTGKSVPNWSKSPKLYGVYFRRQCMFHIRKLLRATYSRFKYKINLPLDELADQAEALYIDLNLAFTRGDEDAIKKLSTMFVSEALVDRIKGMSKEWKLYWELKEFLEEPELIDKSPIDLGDGSPVKFVQLTYRFHTKQEVKLVYKKNSKVPPQVQERNVLDYIVVAYDLNTAEMRIVGSMFECPVTEPLPEQLSATRQLLANMKEKGDIFRKKPSVKSLH
ncbi:mitochondrial inner membrane protein Mba1 [Lipomyces arxii]|uniref:mitochondrial inner membrane protein Mba1 n=1 Tax=Lipomyces arxii TaxID=56418 RepID=UPI0034D00A9C